MKYFLEYIDLYEKFDSHGFVHKVKYQLEGLVPSLLLTHHIERRNVQVQLQETGM